MSDFHATILSLFPQMFPGPLAYSLAGKALKKNIWSYDVLDIRDFGIGKHKHVDDIVYGGGHGLVMRPDVLGPALDKALSLHPNAKIYYPSPRGKLLNQNLIKNIAKSPKVIMLCGRFEGIDERIIDEYNITEISIGDYILSGGEIAVYVTLDCIIRTLDGVVVNSDTLNTESFEYNGILSGLEHPLYTKPRSWRDNQVPEVLLSGNHKDIQKWKLEQSFLITKERRPDLLLVNKE